MRSVLNKWINKKVFKKFNRNKKGKNCEV